MFLSTVKMPLSFSIDAWTVLALGSIASPPARAERRRPTMVATT
jgi:hypothetical protein